MQRLSAVQSYGRILADYGQGRSSNQEALGALVKLAAEESIRYSADAVSLAGDLASAAARSVGLDLGQGLRTHSAGLTAAIRDLEFQGVLGTPAIGALVLHNPRPETVRISLCAACFEGPRGLTEVSPQINPNAFELAPGEERTVQVEANLSPDSFRAGEIYTSRLAIEGIDDMVVRLRLTVLAAD